MASLEIQDERFAFIEGLRKSTVDGVSFMSGWPGKEEMEKSADIMLKATNVILDPSSQDLDDVINYGPEQGCETFIKELSNFLSHQYGSEVPSSSLMVTAAATHGLHMVLTSLIEKPAIVFVEDPTFFIALRVFQKDFEANVVPVRSSATGINLDQLDEKLTALRPTSQSNSERFWAAVYLVTVFNNPSGLVYSPEKCQKLVQMARKHNVLLIADDVYNMLWYPSVNTDSQAMEAPQRLMTFDSPGDPDYGHGHVVSLGSFSKFLSPGLRLGWIESSEKIVSELCVSGVAMSSGSFNHYASKLVSCALKNGSITQHLAHIRKVYGEKLKAMCNTLEKNLPKDVKFTRPKGGFFVWLEFPKNVDTYEFLHFSAERYGVLYIPGVYFSPKEGSRNCARLSFSRISILTIESGIKELCMAYKDYCMMG